MENKEQDIDSEGKTVSEARHLLSERENEFGGDASKLALALGREEDLLSARFIACNPARSPIRMSAVSI